MIKTAGGMARVVFGMAAALFFSALMLAGCGNSASGNAKTFVDKRDGTTYKKVRIGTQTWMAENLNYDNGAGSVCYDYDDERCATYGRLYTWAAAMDIGVQYNYSLWDESDVNHQGVCPAGWHLPNKDEWAQLIDFVGDSAGTKLKSSEGWINDGNGTDDFGFSALPGGMGNSPPTPHPFAGLGAMSMWWSANDAKVQSGGYYPSAYKTEMRSYYVEVDLSAVQKTILYYVRCVQN